jgi:hypothetical protein
MIQSDKSDVREMLLSLGVPPFVATMSIPFMWMTPGATDPDSPSVIEIIRGIQRGIRKLGYRKVFVSGVVDVHTSIALDELSPNWMSKTWIQIAGDVLGGMRNPERKAHQVAYTRKGTSGYFEYQGYPPGPLPGILVGTPPGPLGLGDTSVIDSGVELTWGLGNNNPTNMVPIPKTSGVTYTVFKGLQRQINRLGGKVGEDGIIGTGTVAGFKRVLARLPSSSPAKMRGQHLVTSMALAANAATLVTMLTSEANAAGVASNANQGSTVTSASSETTAGAVTPQQVAAMSANAGIGIALKKYFPFLLIAGGVAWWASKKKKGKR